jgi:acyl transferase domain-containing protein
MPGNDELLHELLLEKHEPIPRAVMPWPQGPRRLAGVSPHGLTGTYSHAVVESVVNTAPHPVRPPAAAAGRSHWPESHLWS